MTRDPGTNVPVDIARNYELARMHRLMLSLVGGVLLGSGLYVSIFEGHDGAGVVAFLVLGAVLLALSILGTLPARVWFKDGGFEMGVSKELAEKIASEVSPDTRREILQLSESSGQAGALSEAVRRSLIFEASARERLAGRWTRLGDGFRVALSEGNSADLYLEAPNRKRAPVHLKSDPVEQILNGAVQEKSLPKGPTVVVGHLLDSHSATLDSGFGWSLHILSTTGSNADWDETLHRVARDLGLQSSTSGTSTQ